MHMKTAVKANLNYSCCKTTKRLTSLLCSFCFVSLR